MPKVRKPKRGWPRFIERLKRRPRFREKNSGVGLPPCPECRKYAMKRDETRGEIYCTICGALLGQ